MNTSPRPTVPRPTVPRQRPVTPGLDDPFPQPFDASHAEVALWRAVIMQAVTDALSGSAKGESISWAAQARAWLTGNSAYFQEVCVMAGLDPHFVMTRTAVIIENPAEKNPSLRTMPRTTKPKTAVALGGVNRTKAEKKCKMPATGKRRAGTARG